VALLDQLLQPVLDRLKVVFRPFGKLFALLSKFWTGITTLGQKVRDLISLVTDEVNEWKNFRENIAFRTRVINVKSAIEHVQDVWQQAIDAYHAVLQLVQELRGKFETTGNPTEEAEQAIADIESSGFKTILEKFPKLLRGAEKALGFVAIVADALESIVTAVDDLTTIVNALKAIRENIETGKSLFLKQSNPRKSIKLKGGGSIRVRTGNLH